MATILAFILVITIDFVFVHWVDSAVWLWPAMMPEQVLPFWLSLPRFAYVGLTGYFVATCLRLKLVQSVAFLAAIVLYYSEFRYGTYTIFSRDLSAYLVAYLPLVSVPLGFSAGYLVACYRMGLWQGAKVVS